MDEANATLPDIELKTNNTKSDINVSVQENSGIIQILHPNKASGDDVISHDPTSQITLSKRSDNVTFSLLQRKHFTL